MKPRHRVIPEWDTLPSNSPTLISHVCYGEELNVGFSMGGILGTEFIQNVRIEIHDTFTMTLLHKLGFKDKMRCQKTYNMLSSKGYSYWDFNEFHRVQKTFFSKYVSQWRSMKSRFKQIIFKLSPLFDLKLILNESILTFNLKVFIEVGVSPLQSK